MDNHKIGAETLEALARTTAQQLAARGSIAVLLLSCVALVVVTAQLEAERAPVTFSDVRYADLMRDPMVAVRALYRDWNCQLSAEAAARMQRFLGEQARARNKHRGHRYSLEQFGLTRAAVADAFRDYEQRFGLINVQSSS